jgi:hypothetical protein
MAAKSRATWLGALPLVPAQFEEEPPPRLPEQGSRLLRNQMQISASFHGLVLVSSVNRNLEK